MMKKIFNFTSIFIVFLVLSSCNNLDMLAKQAPEKPIIESKKTSDSNNENNSNVSSMDDNTNNDNINTQDEPISLAKIGRNLSKNINSFFQKDKNANPSSNNDDDNNIVVAKKTAPTFDFNSNEYIGAHENDLETSFGKADFIAQDKSTKIYQYFSDECTVAFYLNDKKGDFQVIYIDIRHRHHLNDLDKKTRADCAKIALEHRYNSHIKTSS